MSLSSDIPYQSYPPSLWGGGAVVDPSITTLVPNTGTVGTLATVQVNGSDFAADSVVEVDQVPATSTVFVSSSRLTATFTPASAGTVQVTVRNANDEESNSVAFTVSAAELQASPDDSFEQSSIIGSTKTQAAKLAGLGYVAEPDDAWSDGEVVHFNGYAFHWDGEQWAPGAAP